MTYFCHYCQRHKEGEPARIRGGKRGCCPTCAANATKAAQFSQAQRNAHCAFRKVLRSKT